jgi:transcriptional repressor NrdR
VAYLRFASVYRSFSSVADFEKEIAELRSAPARGSAAGTSGGRPADTDGEQDTAPADASAPAATTPRRRAAERPRPATPGSAADQ